MVKSRISCKGCLLETEDIYEGSPKGILVTSRLHCARGSGELRRFGKTFVLDASFDKVSYKGRNAETYPDMRDHAPVEEVRCAVNDMTEPNIRPQESGNRMDTEYAAFSDGVRTVRFRAQGKPFSLSVKPYTDRALMDMKHREDELTTGTYVTIQAFQEGIGTGACGPYIDEEYQYRIDADHEVKFTIEVE